MSQDTGGDGVMSSAKPLTVWGIDEHVLMDSASSCMLFKGSFGGLVEKGKKVCSQWIE